MWVGVFFWTQCILLMYILFHVWQTSDTLWWQWCWRMSGSHLVSVVSPCWSESTSMASHLTHIYREDFQQLHRCHGRYYTINSISLVVVMGDCLFLVTLSHVHCFKYFTSWIMLVDVIDQWHRISSQINVLLLKYCSV